MIGLRGNAPNVSLWENSNDGLVKWILLLFGYWDEMNDMNEFDRENEWDIMIRMIVLICYDDMNRISYLGYGVAHPPLKTG